MTLCISIAAAGCGSGSSSSESGASAISVGAGSVGQLTEENKEAASAEDVIEAGDSGAEDSPAETGAESTFSDAAEYTYYLETERRYQWFDDENGSGFSVADLEYDLLKFEEEYDVYGEKVSSTAVPGAEKALKTINQDTLDNYDAFNEEHVPEAQEWFDGLSEEEKESSGHYEDDNYLTVVRADSRCLSVVRDHYQYMAGAHGYNRTTAYSFDASTGKRLGIADVAADTDKLADILAKVLLETHEPAEFNDVADGDEAASDLSKKIRKLMDGDEYYEGDNDLHYVTWYADNGGVGFVFNQYDLGPYAAGQFRCTLMARDYPDLFLENYIYGPESYSEEISLYEGYTVQGKELLIGEHENEYEMIETVQIHYGDDVLDLEVWGYDVKTFLMTVPDGKFLYLDVSGDNDWHNLYVIDLNGDGLEAKEMEGFGFGISPINPERVILFTRTNLMTTYGVKRSYCLDPSEGGLFKPNETYFTIIRYDANGPVFTMKNDTELNVLDDADSDAVHSETVKKGTTMEMVRTDNESVVDCRTDDGRLIRFTVDDSEWPQRIDGTYSLEDLLDGTLFAG